MAKKKAEMTRHSETKAEATRRGREVIRQLGPDWKLDVFENAGWYYTVYRGSISVIPSTGGYYLALVSDDAEAVTEQKIPRYGSTIWPGGSRAKTPQRAVMLACQQAIEKINSLNLIRDSVMLIRSELRRHNRKPAVRKQEQSR